MFLIFDFVGPIGLKLQKDINQEMFMGRQLGNFHATCYGSDFWRLTALQNFAMPELFILLHALVCEG